MIADPTSLQRDYYARTAGQYDQMQVDPTDEHAIALAWMTALIEQRGYVGQDHLDLPAVPRVDQTRGIEHHDTVFQRKSRTGEHEATGILR